MFEPRKAILVFLVILMLYFILSNYAIRSSISHIRRYGSIIPSISMVEYYTEQAKLRKAKLIEITQDYSREKTENKYHYLYNILVPEVMCQELLRVGTVIDGGKWMCSPKRLPDDCTIVSLGLRNSISFDLDIQRLSDQRCRIYGYDMLIQNENTIQGMELVNGKVGLAKIANRTDPATNEFTVMDLLEKEGRHSIEIFKIDIEGAEIYMLEGFLENYTPAQILIELHSPPGEMARLLALFARFGYWLITYEINGSHHHLSEFSFVHEGSFERYNAFPVARYLDL